MGAGVPVFLFAAPSQASTASVRVGQRVQFPLVAATVTDVSGTYMFPQAGVIATLASMKSEYQQVVVPTLTQAGTQAVNLLQADPAMKDGTVVGGLMAATVTGGTPSNSTVTAASLATHNGAVALPGTAATATQLKAAAAGASGVMPANYGYCSPDGVTCYYETLEKSWTQWVLVGQTSSKSNYATAQFTYVKGASSSLGIGVSASGKAGSYSQSGTMNASSTVTLGFGSKSGIHNIYYYVTFDYGRYRDEVYTYWWRSSLSYVVKPIRFTGGASEGTSGTALHASPSDCLEEPAGMTWTENRTKAVTWTNGVSVGLSDINVNLSANTGYSTTTIVSYTFKAKQYLCGVWDKPAGTPGLLYVATSSAG